MTQILRNIIIALCLCTPNTSSLKYMRANKIVTYLWQSKASTSVGAFLMQEREDKAMCKHKVEHLIGTSDGIKCRLCGKVFKTFAELEADRPQEEKAEEKEIDEIITEEEQAEEKPVEKKATKKATTKKGGKK